MKFSAWHGGEKKKKILNSLHLIFMKKHHEKKRIPRFPLLIRVFGWTRSMDFILFNGHR
jgi:hypothetical protein